MEEDNMGDKGLELALAEKARRAYPWFPPGEFVPVSQDPPDLLLIDGGRQIGIEVTRLFQAPKDGARHAPHEVANFHRRVMVAAERQAAELPPLDVLVYFNYVDQLSDVKKVAASLVEFVKTHPVDTSETFSLDVPQGFSVIRIAHPTANQVPRWRCLDSGKTANLEYDLLAAVIRRKNKRIATYRASVDQCWLLIATTLWPFASTFSVPRDIGDWRFAFDFDKVLLLSDESGVFSLVPEDDAAQHHQQSEDEQSAQRQAGS
jgi:hypothetical protein